MEALNSVLNYLEAHSSAICIIIGALGLATGSVGSLLLASIWNYFAKNREVLEFIVENRPLAQAAGGLVMMYEGVTVERIDSYVVTLRSGGNTAIKDLTVTLVCSSGNIVDSRLSLEVPGAKLILKQESETALQLRFDMLKPKEEIGIAFVLANATKNTVSIQARQENLIVKEQGVVYSFFDSKSVQRIATISPALMSFSSFLLLACIIIILVSSSEDRFAQTGLSVLVFLSVLVALVSTFLSVVLLKHDL